MDAIRMALVIFIAFLVGMEGILDQWWFHQPTISCALIGLVTSNLTTGIVLGGVLQFITMGWANIGAAVTPNAVLASIASAIIMAQGYLSTGKIGTAIGIAVPLTVAGLGLTMIVRTLTVAVSYIIGREVEKANYQGTEFWQLVAIGLQGLRMAIPATLLLAIPSGLVRSWLSAMPVWLSAGMAVSGGMVVAVGYAMVINMMASKEVGPFFIIGSALATIQNLALVALGAVGTALALMYLALEGKGSNNSDSKGTGDPLGDILNSY